MKIHEYAAQGDRAGISRELAQGIAIDTYDKQGLTPLMIAAASTQATPETLTFLLAHGANVNALQQSTPSPLVDANLDADLEGVLDAVGIDAAALLTSALHTARTKPSSVDSVLGYAVKHATLDKIEVLLTAGADVKYVDACGYSILIWAVHRHVAESKADCHRLVSRLIQAGAPLDVVSAYGESALSVASRMGDFHLVKLLLDSGASPSPLAWNALFTAVAFHDLPRVKSLVTNNTSREDRERWHRTPFLLAVHSGSVQIASFLLSQGYNPSAKGNCGQTALQYAIANHDSDMLKWLIAQGADVEEADEFGTFPLLMAAQAGATQCVRELLAAGANVERRDAYIHNAIAGAATPEIVQLLVERDADFGEIRGGMRQKLVGHADLTFAQFAEPTFRAHLHRRFGRRNPERMNNGFWDAMVRSRECAYLAASALGVTGSVRQPVWCFARFGQTITKLPDGRLIEIGGEHEDHYDPDFCIYNDVVVHHGDGTFSIFGYPERKFPPTDFHTATLIGNFIYIIGCLGYREGRREEFTPVYRLNLDSFAIEPFPCTGSQPGWIYEHKAKLLTGTEIEVTGGKIQQDGECRPNENIYHLDISTHTWSRSL